MNCIVALLLVMKTLWTNDKRIVLKQLALDDRQEMTETPNRLWKQVKGSCILMIHYKIHVDFRRSILHTLG